jgi:mannose-6-phosphate isomerase-like protein (cupin superfamily)
MTVGEEAVDMTAQPQLQTDLDFLGSRVRVLATGGALGLVDMVEVPAGDMPPLHVHHREDEGFYVLEGRLTLYLPDGSVELGPGEFALAPRGVPHAYEVGDEPARWLNTSTPAGFERFVSAVAAIGAVDPATLTAVAAEHGIEILGPPGARP